MSQYHSQNPGHGGGPAKTASGLPGQGLHPLLGRYDLDPGNWRPLWYRTEIQVGVNDMDINAGTIRINNMPYIWTGTTHQIIGNTADPTTSGLYQDGMYDVRFSDEQTQYQDTFIMANLIFGMAGASAGGNNGGFIQNMPYPIPFAGSRSVNFEVRNRVARTLTGDPGFYTVQIALCGLSSWGKARSRRA